MYRFIAWVSLKFFDGMTYTVRHGLNKGSRRHGGLGWLPFSLKSTPEDSFWQQVNLAGLVVYDVGAFHGLLTLHFAAKAKTVVSYEPNSHNYTRLSQNVTLNRLDNVIVRKIGIGAKSGQAEMVSDPRARGTSSIGSTRDSDYFDREMVSVTTLDEDIRENGLPAPDFIKIDTEGFELAVLRGARQTILEYQPQIFLELHGNTPEEKCTKAAEVVNYLTRLGYDIQHIESGQKVTADDLWATGHLYASLKRDVAAEVYAAAERASRGVLQ